MKPSYLISYWYAKQAGKTFNEILDNADRVNLMIDSGAFTAYKCGANITVKEYIAFCKQIKQYTDKYIMLDVIRSPAKSKDNYKAMLDAGLEPIPIWIEGDSIEDFRWYYENSNKYVCISGGRRDRADFLYRCRMAKYTFKDIKIHALAYVQLPGILKLPIYSADSSTFISGSKYGRVVEYDYRKKKFNMIASFIKRNGPSMELVEAAGKCNTNAKELIQNKQLTVGAKAFSCAYSMNAYLNASSDYARCYDRYIHLADSGAYWKHLMAVLDSKDGQYFDYKKYRSLLQ